MRSGRIVQADVRLDGDMALAVGLDLGGGMDPGGGVFGPDGNGEENDAEHKREDTAHGITSKMRKLSVYVKALYLFLD